MKCDSQYRLGRGTSGSNYHVYVPLTRSTDNALDPRLIQLVREGKIDQTAPTSLPPYLRVVK